MKVQVAHTGDVYEISTENIISVNDLKQEIQRRCSIPVKTQLLLTIDGDEVNAVSSTKQEGEENTVLVFSSQTPDAHNKNLVIPQVEVPSIHERLEALRNGRIAGSGEFTYQLRECEEYIAQIKAFSETISQRDKLAQHLKQRSHEIKQAIQALQKYRQFVASKTANGVEAESKAFNVEIKRKEQTIQAISEQLEIMTKMQVHKALADDNHTYLADFFDKQAYSAKLQIALKTICNINKQFEDTKSRYSNISNKDADITFEKHVQEMDTLTQDVSELAAIQAGNMKECLVSYESIKPLVEDLDQSADFSGKQDLSDHFMQIPDYMSMILATSKQKYTEVDRLLLQMKELYDQLNTSFTSETNQISKFSQQAQVLVQSLTVLYDLLCSNRYFNDILNVPDFIANYEEGKKEVKRRRQFKANLQGCKDDLREMVAEENTVRRNFLQDYPYASLFIRGLDEEASSDNDFDTNLPEIDDIIDMNWIVDSHYYREGTNTTEGSTSSSTADAIETPVDSGEENKYTLLASDSAVTERNTNNNESVYKSAQTFATEDEEIESDFDASQSAEFSDAETRSTNSDSSFEVVERLVDEEEFGENQAPAQKIESYEQRIHELQEQNISLHALHENDARMLAELHECLNRVEQELNAELSELKAENDELSSTKISLSETSQKLLNQVEQLQQSLADTAAQNVQLQDNLSTLQTKVASMSEELELVTAEKSNLMEIICATEGEHAEKSSNYESRLAQFSSTLLQLQKEKEEMDGIINAHKEAFDTLKNQHDSDSQEFLELKQMFEQIKQEKAELEEEVQDLRAQLSSVQSENVDLNEEIKQMVSLQSQTEQRFSEEIEAMGQQFEALKHENQEAQEYHLRASLLETKVGELEQECDHLKEELEQSLTQADENSRIHSQLLLCLSEANEKNNELQQQYEEVLMLHDCRTGELQEKCQQMVAENEKLKVHAEEQAKSSSQAVSELNDQLAQSSKREQEIKNQNSELNDYVQSLQTSVEKISCDYASLQEKHTDLENAFQEQASMLLSREKTILDIDEIYTKLELQNDASQNIIEDQKLAIAHLENQMDEITTSFERESAERNAKVASLEAENAQLRRQIKDNTSDLEHKIAELEVKLSETSDMVENKTLQAQMLDDTLRQYEEEINTATKAKQEYLREIELLEDTVRKEKQGRLVLEQEFDTLSRECQRLESLSKAQQTQQQQQPQPPQDVQRALKFAQIEAQASKEILKNIKDLLKVTTIDQIVGEIARLRQNNNNNNNNNQPQQMALRDLKKGDIAMFSTNPTNGNYQAVLHPSCQPYFLKLESLQNIGYRSWVEARVTSVQTFRAQPANMYGLPVNTSYCEVLAEPVAFGEEI